MKNLLNLTKKKAYWLLFLSWFQTALLMFCNQPSFE